MGRQFPAPPVPPAPPFAGPADAVAAVTAGLAFLAATDTAGLPADSLAGCLRDLSRAESAHVAARSRLLSAFTAQDGSQADGHPTTRSWVRWQTRVTAGAASAELAWMRRLARHPHVARALSEGAVSVSWARQVCEWTDQLPPDLRAGADQILLAGLAGGADLADAQGLFREMLERSAAPDADGPAPADDDGFADRRVGLALHWRGSGFLTGDLTPECAAFVTTVLDSLGKRAGPEDDRSEAQRHHDALEEACRRLLAAGGLPDIAGQPALIQLHTTLDQLRALVGPAGEAAGSPVAPVNPAPSASPAPPVSPPPPGSPDAVGTHVTTGGCPAPGTTPDPARGDRDGWAATGAFLAGRAAGDGQPGWLSSAAAAEAYCCDAKISTVVTGYIDPEAVAAAVRVFLDWAADPRYRSLVTGLSRGSASWPPEPPRSAGWPGPTGPPETPACDGTGPPGLAGQFPSNAPPGMSAPPGMAAPPGMPAPPGSAYPRGVGPPGHGLAPGSPGPLPAALTRYALDMLSGPAGLAARLRARLPGILGAGVSLPLDIGEPTATVPPHLRRAVAVRDRHCAFPGCAQRPAACQVHHLIPRAQGGVTALRNLALLCSFHHLIAVHRWGWQVVLNADGTTTATSPDGRRVFHSHRPPTATAA